MAKLLLNLRHVPQDEADEVRELLSTNGIDYYETRPSLWGISAGGIWLHDAGLHADMTARTLLGSMLTGDAQRTALAGLRRILKVPPVNTIAARRRIADAVSAKHAYPFA